MGKLHFYTCRHLTYSRHGSIPINQPSAVMVRWGIQQARGARSPQLNTECAMKDVHLGKIKATLTKLVEMSEYFIRLSRNEFTFHSIYVSFILTSKLRIITFQ